MSGVSSADEYHPGLEGVIASETAIANIEGTDGAGGLEYRGYRIEDLAGHVSYEETAFLLLHGDLPTRSAVERIRRSPQTQPRDSRAAGRALSQIPSNVHPMDVLRSSVSVLAHFDPDNNAPPTDHAANVRKAERLVAQMATAVAFRERIVKGLPVIEPRDDLDHAANFLNMVNGKVPSPTMREAFDLSMVLYTEHELNASTFSARVTVSTLSDIYSGIVAAIGTLKGPLHGGANEEAWKVLERVGSPENAEHWIEDGAGPQGADHGVRPPRLQERRPPRRRSSSATASSWPRKSATTAGSESPSRSSGSSPPRSTFRPTSTGRAPASITTWGWTSTSTRRSSRWPASPAGRPTSSSSSTTTA